MQVTKAAVVEGQTSLSPEQANSQVDERQTSQLPQQADSQVAAANTEVIREVHGRICAYLYAYQYISCVDEHIPDDTYGVVYFASVNHIPIRTCTCES